MTLGSWWSRHFLGPNLTSCESESREKSSSPSTSVTSSPTASGSNSNHDDTIGYDEEKKRNDLSQKVNRLSSYPPVYLATSPSTSFFTNTKDSCQTSTFTSTTHAPTFRTRKPLSFQGLKSKSEGEDNKYLSSIGKKTRKYTRSSGRRTLIAAELEQILYGSQDGTKKTEAALASALLPFPSDMVGTYTCHGLEPSEYLHLVDPLTGGMNGTKPGNTQGTVDRITGLSFVMKKINQDRGNVAYPYGNDHKCALFAVYDGHGEGGERVAQFAMTELEKRLCRHPEFETNIDKALKDVFLSIDRSLQEDPIIDPTFCGTTACIVVMRNNKLHISNIGDSRAILCRKTSALTSSSTTTSSDSSDNRNRQKQQPKTIRTTIELTQDQNPDLPAEKKRIERAGGYVSPSPEPGVSARVWINPTHTFLGLAMSRSVGDFFLKNSGVIVEPVVSTLDLNCKTCHDHRGSQASSNKSEKKNGENISNADYEDEFIVLASDGLWEYMDSEEVVELVGKALDEGLGASEACKKLIVTAAMRWKDFDYYYRDDITAIVVKFDKLFDTSKKKKAAKDNHGDANRG